MPRVWLSVDRDKIVQLGRVQFLTPLLTLPFLRIELIDGSMVDAALVHAGVRDMLGYRKADYDAIGRDLRWSAPAIVVADGPTAVELFHRGWGNVIRLADAAFTYAPSRQLSARTGLR